MTSGIDMDAIKSRLNKLKNSNRKSDLIWKPTEEKQNIRIVPYKYHPDNPFIELYFHYDLAGKTYISPVSFGERDPIMEIAQKLKSAGDKVNWKLGKDLEPKLRTFAPIIIRGKEHEGIKFWGFGKTVYEFLLQNIADPDCGDITHPVNGRDLVVWSEKEEGKNFPTPKVNVKMKQSKVIDTDTIANAQEVMEKITKHQPDIKELWEVKSYEELKVALDRHLNPESEDDSSDDSSDNSPKKETPRDSDNEVMKPKSDTSEEPVEESTTENVEDDLTKHFDDLFASD